MGGVVEETEEAVHKTSTSLNKNARSQLTQISLNASSEVSSLIEIPKASEDLDLLDDWSLDNISIQSVSDVSTRPLSLGPFSDYEYDLASFLDLAAPTSVPQSFREVEEFNATTVDKEGCSNYTELFPPADQLGSSINCQKFLPRDWAEIQTPYNDARVDNSEIQPPYNDAGVVNFEIQTPNESSATCTLQPDQFQADETNEGIIPGRMVQRVPNGVVNFEIQTPNESSATCTLQPDQFQADETKEGSIPGRMVQRVPNGVVNFEIQTPNESSATCILQPDQIQADETNEGVICGRMAHRVHIFPELPIPPEIVVDGVSVPVCSVCERQIYPEA